MARQTYKVTALSDRHSLVKLSDRIAIITRALKRKGKAGKTAAIVAGYFGFATQKEAQAFVNALRGYFPKSFCQVRPSQRLATPFEVKVRAFAALERFAWSVATKPAIVSAAEAKADLHPIEPMQPVRPIQPMKVKPIELAPLQVRSNRPLKVAGLAIE